MSDLSGVIRSERLALIDYLETLGPEQWAARSLCTAWTVQDVAAHLAWAPVMGIGESLGGLARSGLRINAFIADSAVRAATRGTDAILDQLRANARSGATPIGMPPIAALGDAVVHPLDIRRPLDSHRPIPAEAFAPTADFFAHTRWPASVPVGGSVVRRIRGLRLVATDVDWAHGRGAEVRGTAEALMLVLAGRPVHAGELTGPGAAVLHTRL
ncbi:maleylpyruvate isomerase family mycothiol-dependent enzyme [Nocardioides sp. MAHUQ-72]|uniref:maleylpyruvate isomerase family mycothiol-dependent enzyme n=1 Tax=unclassified Nocardioides TaxID=2615069 RepID=UPI00360EEFD8